MLYSFVPRGLHSGPSFPPEQVAEAKRRVMLKRAIRRRLKAVGFRVEFWPNMNDWDLHRLKDFAGWLAAPLTTAIYPH